MSDADFTGILEKLDSPEDIAKNLQGYLPNFIEILEDKSYDSYYLKIITTLLGAVTTFIDPLDLEKQLLAVFLPSVNSSFESALEEIVSLLENNSEFEEENAINLSKYLQLSLNAIDGYFELVAVLNKIKDLEVGNVTTLVKALPTVLEAVFLHCNGSEQLYGCYFSDSTTLLSALFIKSYQLYLNFCKLLETNVSFKLSYEEDIIILVQISDHMCSINEIVIKLDIKATALVWKHYAAIICRYSRDLKDRLNMQKTVTCLCTSITETITRLTGLSFVKKNDSKTRETLLKLGNFLLKILVKLCELYESYLNDCFLSIFNILVRVCSCSRTSGLKCTEKEELNRFISVASATLIKLLLSEDQFRKAVEDKLEESFEKDKIGTFFFTILLMRKICQEPKRNDKWFSYPFVERAINFYDGCGYSIDGNSITEGTNTYFFIIYTIGLFILAPAYSSSFSEAEKFLVQKLVAQNIPTAVLSSDILAFICRHANEQYCCDVASILWTYLGSWSSCQWRPEFVIVGCTFERLFKTLPSTMQKLFCSEDPGLIRWSGIRESQSEIKLDLNGDACNYMSQVARLSYSNKLETFLVDDFLNVVQAIVNPPFCSKWQENVMIGIFRIAAKIIPQMSSAQREVVSDYLLQSVLNDNAQPSVRLKISTCRFVATVTQQSAANDLNEGLLSQVLLTLLRSQENTLVFLRAILLMFSVSSHLRSKDDLLATFPSNVHPILTSFMNDVTEDDDVLEITASENLFAHKCIKLEDRSSSLESEPATKKIKISEVSDNTELHVVISRLKDDLSKIKNLISNDPALSCEVKGILSSCAKDFEFIKDFI